MRHRSLVCFSHPLQAFVCAACLETKAIPYNVLTNPEACVGMLENMQLDHAACESVTYVQDAQVIRSFARTARRQQLLKSGSPFARA